MTAVGVCWRWAISPTAALLIATSLAAAQVPGEIFGIFQGLAAAAASQAAREEWNRLPPPSRLCFSIGLQRHRATVDRLAQQAIGPNHPRLDQIRATCDRVLTRRPQKNVSCTILADQVYVASYCDEVWTRRGTGGHAIPLELEEVFEAAHAGNEAEVQKIERSDAASRRRQMHTLGERFTAVVAPSFDCEKASNPSDTAICNSAELASLEKRYADAVRKARSIDKKGQIGRDAISLLRRRNSCNGSTSCVKQSLIAGIDSTAAFLKRNGVSAVSYAEEQELKRRQAEDRRLSDERQRQEQRRLDEERAREQQARLAEERRAAEEARLRHEADEIAANVAAANGRLSQKRKHIEEKRPGIKFESLRQRVDEALVRLSALEPEIGLADLQALERLADQISGEIGQLEEFDRISSIAGRRIEAVQQDLSTVVTDASYLQEILQRLGEVASARTSGSLPMLQAAMAQLERTYQANRSNIDRDRFSSP